jgi:hypothetical protein
MHPGSIVQYDPPPGTPGRIPVPNSDLFGESCLVPGASLAAQRATPSSSQPEVSIPNFSYGIDRSLKDGTDVSIPKLYNMTFRAGPNWTDVSKIDLSTEKAWIATLDEIAAASAYKSCQIRTSCADYIRAAKYRVVGSTIVAKGINYKVIDRNGNVVSLSGGVSSGKFRMTVGADSTTTTDLNATVESPQPRVIGVRLLRDSVFAGEQTCQELIVFTPSATVTATIVGGGGKGSIGQVKSEEKALGETVKLQKDGTEESEP